MENFRGLLLPRLLQPSPAGSSPSSGPWIPCAVQIPISHQASCSHFPAFSLVAPMRLHVPPSWGGWVFFCTHKIAVAKRHYFCPRTFWERDKAQSPFPRKTHRHKRLGDSSRGAGNKKPGLGRTEYAHLGRRGLGQWAGTRTPPAESTAPLASSLPPFLSPKERWQ